MRSPSVFVDGCYWNIKAYPRGNEGSTQMSVYIECSTSPIEEPGIAIADDVQDAGVPASGEEAMSRTTNNEHQNTSQPNETNNAMSTDSIASEGNVNRQQKAFPPKDVSRPAERWEMPAQILCVAYNPQDSRVLAYDKAAHRFHDESPDWGWRRFHGPWNKMHVRERYQRRALLQNDTLCFTAYIRTIKDHTGALFWHAPSGKPNWDHYERLGLNRMLAGSAGSSAAVSALSTWVHLYPASRSIHEMQQDLDEKFSERPLFDELEHWRQEFLSSSKEQNHDVTFESAVEMVDWYDTGDCEADVIAFWETLRRILSFEASDVKSIAEAKDLFDDILLLKQPDSGKAVFDAGNGGLSKVSGSQQDQLTEPKSVQEALELATTYEHKDDRVWKTFDGNKHELKILPGILQIELHRQQYDTMTRKWRKLSHKIRLDETVVFQDNKYTLFGMVVHSGSLESKDYCSILRPQGPDTRWIKYAGDKADRGVEVLTTKQAISAHEGAEDASVTSPVAYIVTYVRADLLPKLAVEPKKEDTAPESSSQAPETEEKGSDGPMDQDDEEDTLPIYIYQSDLFVGHSNLGVFNWCERGLHNADVMKIDVPSEVTPAGIANAIIKNRKERFPDQHEKYAMWFLNTLLNNAAMDSVMRAPQAIPLTDRPTDELMKLSGIFYGPCRVWVQVMPSAPEERHGPDSSMLEASATMPAPNAGDPVQNNSSSILPTNEQGPEAGLGQSTGVTPAIEQAAVVEESAQNTTDPPVNEPPTSEAPAAEDGDTHMEGNADVAAENVPPPAPPKPTWNPQLDTETLSNTDNVYIFLKFFDHDTQSLRGIKCFFAKSTEKVGERIRSELSLTADQLIDVYEEKISSITRPVSTDSRFLDISSLSTHILVAQRRPSSQE